MEGRVVEERAAVMVVVGEKVAVEKVAVKEVVERVVEARVVEARAMSQPLDNPSTYPSTPRRPGLKT